MRNLILLLLFLIFVGNLISSAQSRFPIKATSVWRTNYEFPRYEWTTHAIGDEEYKCFIGGDTIIAGIQYFKFMKSGILYLDTPFVVENKYLGAIRDNDNKFYFVPKDTESEKMLYDFDATVGSNMADKDGGLRPISDIEILADGRKKFQFDFMTVHCGSANTVIEGIGWLGGLLEGNSCSGHPGVRGSYLVCYSEDGIKKYESPIATMYELPCADPTTSSSSFLKQNLKFSLKHSTLRVFSPDNSAKIESAEIYNALGNKVMVKKGNWFNEYATDISSLENGMYLLKITSNSQPMVFKFIKN